MSVLQQRLDTPASRGTQYRTISSSEITVDDAIALGRARFSNLSCAGILPRKATGTPIDKDDVAIALAILARCRQTKVPTMHTHDLCRMLGGLQAGAVIAAAVALGFDVRTFYGIVSFGQHALVAVNRADVKRLARPEP